MPVFWFALSFVPVIHIARATGIFIFLHLFLYPSSNGYNSYMDRDTTSIGGIANPLQPTRQLYLVTIVLDLMGILFAFFISPYFTAGYIFYIICSRLYSYRGVRLKRFPVIGYLTVILNQGFLIFFMVYHGSDPHGKLAVPWQGLLAAGFLIGGFYPITQIYQHAADAKDKVKTISMVLGKKGTFHFCAVMYLAAFALLFQYYRAEREINNFFLIQLFFVPVIVFFIRWYLRVRRNAQAADFHRTMQMNWLAATCTNAAFITLLILHQIG